MKDVLTYSSDNPTIIELLDQGVYFSEHMLQEFSVQKNQRFPAIIQSQNRKVQVMRWGIENPIMATGPELFYLFGPTLSRQESLKTILRKQRIVIPVKQYSQQLLDGRAYVLKNSSQNILYLAGVWYSGEDKDPGFALITRNFDHDSTLKRLPLLISSNKVKTWLDSETPILSVYNDFIDHNLTYNVEYKESGKMKV